MKILAAENNVSFTANNACKIYIIKQVEYSQKEDFENKYADLLNANSFRNKVSSFLSKSTASLSTTEKSVKLDCLIDYDYRPNPPYTVCSINMSAPDRPRFKVKSFGGQEIEPQFVYFLTDLFQLRNCPLLDLDKLAYVFQIDGQTQGGLANVVSFNTNFSVNGQSTAEIMLNNKDFKYNFKYFNDKSKYPLHLKSYFDTNDIIIIRYQRKNNTKDSLLNSFKTAQIDYWKDPYIESKNDPFTTIFTGYINDINDSFSFSNGQQTVTLSCTGPSKKLTWTRFLSNQAAASKDAGSRILPLSAFVNPQTQGENGKTSIDNAEVVKNVIVRTFSGVINIPDVKDSYKTFVDAFDENNNIKTTSYIKDLEDKIKDSTSRKDIKKIEEYNAQLTQYKTDLQKKISESREKYNKTIEKNMWVFCDGDNKETNYKYGWIAIKKNRFLDGKMPFQESPYIFKINGTNQPAYQWTFNNLSSLFKSDWSTVYQFIKGIADNLQFNFYDDPYGTIHFSVPDMSLLHLQNEKHPNNLNQLSSFTETQNTENIANIQFCNAQSIFSNLPLEMINTVAKDYRSIQKYGEKLMQPFQLPGLTDPTAIRYAAKMRMAKYNRKALSNIRVNLNGEPNLEFDKYAYIKSLRKLFYVESYSHSYTAGGQFTTSLNGTYTRDILAVMDMKIPSSKKIDNYVTVKDNTLSAISELENQRTYKNMINDFSITGLFENQLKNASSVEDVINILSNIEFSDSNILTQKIYQIYVYNWNYPENDENLKLDIGAMYNANNLKQCLLDGFFWALPFDVDPYSMAKQIEEDEKKRKSLLVNTITTKRSAQNQTNKMNKQIQKNITELNNTIKKGLQESVKNSIAEYNIIKAGGSVIKSVRESSVPYTELENGVRIYDYSNIRKSMSVGVAFDISKIDLRPGKMLDVGVQSFLEGDKE